MNNKGKKWTPKEWTVFLKLVSEKGIAAASREHAGHTGRSVHAIHYKYYETKKQGKLPAEIKQRVRKDSWTVAEVQKLKEILQEKEGSIRETARTYAEESKRTVQAVITFISTHRELLEMGDAKKSKMWTDKELEDLLSTIEQYPHNFNEAYRTHAEKYDRAWEDVKHKFYEYRKDSDAKICAMTIGGKKKASPNRKNIHPGTGGEVTQVRKSWWRQILGILGL